MVAFNGLFLSANGIFMLVAPLTWYELVPGVTDTGFFNQHFVRDIGIIQLFLGVAFIVGLLRPERRIGLWAAATLWLIAHALFHLWEVAEIGRASCRERVCQYVEISVVAGSLKKQTKTSVH